MMEEKIYFIPGDIVTLRKDVTNKPTKMLVIDKEVSHFKQEGGKLALIGIKCMWFTTDNTIQIATFNTKDLLKIN